jgi:hypothetical protein
MSATCLLRKVSQRSCRAPLSSVALASSSSAAATAVTPTVLPAAAMSMTHHNNITMPSSPSFAPFHSSDRPFSSSSTSISSHDSSGGGVVVGKSKKLNYPIVPRGDFGEYQEFSVIFTNRSLNLMSKPFQQIMRDLNDLLKATYNAHKVAIMPG